jgi:hypothetical protein
VLDRRALWILAPVLGRASATRVKLLGNRLDPGGRV